MPETLWRVIPPRRVLVGARAHRELIDGIRARRPGLEMRGAPHLEVTQQDLDWADAYLGFRRPPTAFWGSVKWIHCTGAGVDAFLFPTPIPDAILLTKTSEPFGPAIAEFTLSRALAFTQNLRRVERQQREKRWQSVETQRLAGSKVLVIGTGEVGAAIAELFNRLGCVVDGVSRSGTAKAGFRRVHPVRDLTQAVGDATFLVLATPLTRDTERMVTRDVLSRCRGCYLINVGRGAVLDEPAIPEALDAGWLRGAALDVFAEEPLPTGSPLWEREDVMVSPHGSGPTTIPAAVESFLETLASVERGERPIGLVDRERGY